MKRNAAFLSGGGLDSAAFLAQYSDIGVVVVCNYGQVMFEEELDATKKLVKLFNVDCPVRVINCIDKNFTASNSESLLMGLGTEPIVNARNLWMALHTFLVMPSIDHVLFGLCLEDMMFPDADEHAMASIRNACNISFSPKRNVNVLAPFIRVPKLQHLTRTHAINPNFWNAVFTCWSPIEGKECGQCAHCTKKQKLMEKIQYDAT